MSKTIAEILKHFHEFDAAEPESELLQIKSDIERALHHVEFTDDERNIIRALFLIEPPSPQRITENKSGGTSGRPKGGSTQQYISNIMLDNEKSENARNIEVSRKLRSACAKIAAYLGPEYQD